MTTLYRHEGQMGVEDVETSSQGTSVTRYGLGARGVDLIERTNSSGTVTAFPIYDAHGNDVASLTRNGSGGFSIGDRRTYDAWGVVRAQQGGGDPKLMYCASLGHRYIARKRESRSWRFLRKGHGGKQTAERPKIHLPVAETDTTPQAPVRKKTLASAVLSKYFKTLSGSVDGLNFAATEYGTVMRSEPKRKPRNPTSAQLAQEDRIRRAARGYAALTKAQVEAWASFATTTQHLDKQGKPFTPNAYQSYSALSAVWYAANGTAQTAPANPPTAALAVPAGFSLTASAASGRIAFTSTDGAGEGNVVELGVQRLANANRRPSKGGYRIAAYGTFDDARAEVDVTVAPGVYVARYRVIQKATGLRSAYVEIAVSGVALALEDGGAVPMPASRKKAA